uniref:Centromere protein X n=1 Tax=Esox lucius TaxID=8010 RepID=A0AAY5L470_ESOLU
MQPITVESALIEKLKMAESSTEITFKKNTVSKLLLNFFKEEKTKVSSDAVLLMAEMLYVFVEEAAQRTIKQAVAEDCDKMDIEHFEKILPQLGGSLSPSRPTIAAVVGRRVSDHRKAEGITLRICGMIEKDMMPISTTDGEGFRELLHYMEPGYDIRSRATITTHLEAPYKNKKAELKTQLAAANVALTTDCWMALTTESYIITCHYIGNDWQIKSAVLVRDCQRDLQLII